MPRFQPSKRFLDYRRSTFPNFSERVHNEEQFKIEVALPYLASLGYQTGDLEFARRIEVRIGTRTHSVEADIVANFEGEPFLVIDTKSPSERVTETDVLQAVSYAKLISTPPAPFGIAINGYECSGADITTGARLNDIPAKRDAIEAFKTRRPKPLSEIILQETRRVLNTIDNKEELYALIKECKHLIERQGGIRNDISFREMTKILLVKMAEERRAQDEECNRFSLEYLKAFARANGIDLATSLRWLFREATEIYRDIYGRDENIKVGDTHVIEELVKRLENFSFTGTGDDIKGAVYEIFLKSQLRGELDQYFTPREIVEYMITLADPKPGERILDAACGSGGFLINAFRHVKQKIDNSADSDSAKRQWIDAGITDFLWGVEVDADLHTLAKINLVMHGDGYSHIICGDGLSTKGLEEGSFDAAVMNPPFTTACSNRAVLDNFELGQGRETQELDILFVERAVRALKPGGRLFIVLPEGMLNLPSYADFRGWLAQHCELTHTTSLPEGAFQPFGNSASKTCILGVRRKPERPKGAAPIVFAARAQAIGYEPGRKDYRRTDGNDLVRFVDVHDGLEDYAGDPCREFEAVKVSSRKVATSRFDAGAYLNAFEKENLTVFQTRDFVNFAQVARVRQAERIHHREVLYFQADWLAAETGVIQRTAKMVRQGRHNRLRSGDIFLVSINPKLNRVVLVPDGISEIWTTNEGFTIELIERSPFVHIGYLAAALRAPYVVRQMMRLATGSSSSRARLNEEDLAALKLPLVGETAQRQLGDVTRAAANASWRANQQIRASLDEAAAIVGFAYEKPPAFGVGNSDEGPVDPSNSEGDLYNRHEQDGADRREHDAHSANKGCL